MGIRGGYAEKVLGENLASLRCSVTLTLEAAAAIAACVHPRGVVIANAPYHTSAVGLYDPQVASHLSPEPAGVIKPPQPHRPASRPSWS